MKGENETMLYTTMRALGKAIAEDGLKSGVFKDYESQDAVVAACWSFAVLASDRNDWMTPTLAEQVGDDKPIHPDFRLGVLDVEIPGVRE